MLCGERRSGRNRKPLSILSPKGNLSSQIHLRGAQGERWTRKNLQRADGRGGRCRPGRILALAGKTLPRILLAERWHSCPTGLDSEGCGASVCFQKDLWWPVCPLCY